MPSRSATQRDADNAERNRYGEQDLKDCDSDYSEDFEDFEDEELTAPAPTPVKYKFNGSLRRANLTLPLTLSALHKQLVDSFPTEKAVFENKQLRVEYTDDEGDKIAVATDEELQAAQDCAQAANKILLLEVSVKAHTATQPQPQPPVQTSTMQRACKRRLEIAKERERRRRELAADTEKQALKARQEARKQALDESKAHWKANQQRLRAETAARARQKRRFFEELLKAERDARKEHKTATNAAAPASPQLTHASLTSVPLALPNVFLPGQPVIVVSSKDSSANGRRGTVLSVNPASGQHLVVLTLKSGVEGTFPFHTSELRFDPVRPAGMRATPAVSAAFTHVPTASLQAQDHALRRQQQAKDHALRRQQQAKDHALRRQQRVREAQERQLKRREQNRQRALARQARQVQLQQRREQQRKQKELRKLERKQHCQELAHTCRSRLLLLVAILVTYMVGGTWAALPVFAMGALKCSGVARQNQRCSLRAQCASVLHTYERSSLSDFLPFFQLTLWALGWATGLRPMYHVAVFSASIALALKLGYWVLSTGDVPPLSPRVENAWRRFAPKLSLTQDRRDRLHTGVVFMAVAAIFSAFIFAFRHMVVCYWILHFLSARPQAAPTPPVEPCTQTCAAPPAPPATATPDCARGHQRSQHNGAHCANSDNMLAKVLTGINHAPATERARLSDALFWVLNSGPNPNFDDLLERLSRLGVTVV